MLSVQRAWGPHAASTAQTHTNPDSRSSGTHFLSHMAAAGIRAAFEDRGLSFEGDDAAEKAAQLAQDTGCPVSKLVRQYEAFAANR